MPSLDVPMFVNAELTEKEIAELKQYTMMKYNANLFVSEICGRLVYWRGMTRSEYKSSLKPKLNNIAMNAKSAHEAESDNEDGICQEIILHPALGVGEGMIDLRTVEAGFTTQLASEFLSEMGFVGNSVGPVKL